jgi:hypothetical protein
MKVELQTILKESYRMGKSLSQLSTEYKIPKRTIHYNLTKIGVIRKKNAVKFLKKPNDLLIGTFVGIWAGDGSKFYDKGYIIKIHFNKKNTNLANFYVFLFDQLFDKKFRIYNDGGNRASVKIFSKFVFDFLDTFCNYGSNKTYTVRLKKKRYKKSFLRGFLLGLMITDGYITYSDCVFTSISEKLILNAKNALSTCGFESSIKKYKNRDWHMVYRLRIKDPKNFNKFLSKTLEDLGWGNGVESILLRKNSSTI